MALVNELCGYWFSDKIAPGHDGAQGNLGGQAPDLHQWWRKLSVQAGLQPRVYIIPQDTPTPSLRRNPEHAAVAVTEGICGS